MGYRDVILGTTGLVGYWRVGETSGTAAASETGTNSGTYNGSPVLGQPSLLTNDPNTSVLFDGVNDVVIVPDSASLDFTTGLTMEALVKYTAGNDGVARQIMRKAGSWGLRKHTTSGKLDATVVTTGSSATVLSPLEYNDGNVHHFVATWDGSIIRLYVDGLEVNTGPLVGVLPVNANPLGLGGSADITGLWAGHADEFALYNVALSPTTIAEHSAAALIATPARTSAWVGNVTPTSATIKAYPDIDQPTLSLQYATNEQLVGSTTVIGVKDASSGVFTFNIAGLQDNTTYYYGFESEVPAHSKFKTFPSGAASFSVVMGGDTGQTSGDKTSNAVVFDKIRQREPAAFFHLGDLNYRDANTTDPAKYRTIYRDVLAKSRFADLVSNIPTAYTWDDHDYGSNDGNSTYTGKAVANQVYREHVPHWALPDTGHIYHTFSIGRVRFIQLDSRSGRSPNTDPDTPAKSWLGATQKQWLKTTLLAATEPVIILNVVSWIGEYTDGNVDGWPSFSTERQELYEFFTANNLINRLFLVGADMHVLMLDDGSNLNYATDEPGPPYFGFSPLDASFVDMGATPQNLYKITNSQYGTLSFEDDGENIAVVAKGWAVNSDGTETEVFSYTRQADSIISSQEPERHEYSEGLILQICDKDWNQITVTGDQVSASRNEELGSVEGEATVTIQSGNPVIPYLPDPDSEEPEERRFRLYDTLGHLEFAGTIERPQFGLDNVTFVGKQRGIELASRNVGRRDFLGWPLPELFKELLRDTSIGRAPFATVSATNQDPNFPALNAVTGEPKQHQYWTTEYTGIKPSTFVTAEEITIDLGEIQEIDAIRVMPDWWTGKWYNYSLLISDDNSTYVEYTSKGDSLPTTDKGILYELTSVSGRYVKLAVTSSSDGYPRIAALLVYQNLATVGEGTTYAVPWIENDTSANIVYMGTTNRVVQDGAFPSDDGSFVTQLGSGASATHTFRGTATSVYFTQNVSAQASIYLDGVWKTTVTIPANSYQYKGYEVTGLDSGQHTLKVMQVEGNPQIDYFSGMYESSYRSAEEDEPQIGYSGKWIKEYSSAYYGNALIYTDDTTATVNFPFYGDSIVVYGRRNTNRGKFNWYIDNVLQGTVDQYGSVASKYKFASWKGSYGSHVLRIEHSGSKHASSSGYRLAFDRFEGNWAHSLYLRSAHDTNLLLLQRLSEMTNSFIKLNYDGTVSLVSGIGEDTGLIIREGENEGGNMIEATRSADFSDTASAILALGVGTDNNTLRSFVVDKTAIKRMGIKVARIENRDAVDAYLLTRQAWQTLQESKYPRRDYSATYHPEHVGEIGVGDLVRLFSPTLGLRGDNYRVFRKQTDWDEAGVTQVVIQVANRRDSLSKLLNRASRDLNVTTGTPQGYMSTVQYGGNSENFVAETGGSEFRSAEVDFYVDDDSAIMSAKLRMKITGYRTYERDSASASAAVGTSGASSITSSGSGGSATPTSGASSASTSGSTGGHNHLVATYMSGTPSLGSDKDYRFRTSAGADVRARLYTQLSNDLYTDSSVADHQHGITHTHTVTILAHEHNIAHDHSVSIPGHSHTSTYDIYEDDTQMPSSLSVKLDGIDITYAIGGPFTGISKGTTIDADLTGLLFNPGWHTLRFEAGSGKARITPYVLVKALHF